MHKKLSLLFCCVAGSLCANPSFDVMMGKESGYYKKQLGSDESAFLSHLRDEFSKKEMTHEDNTYHTPKIIHFIWLGPRPFPAQSVKNMRSFLIHHPDWKCLFWTDRERPQIFNEVEVRLVKDFKFKHLKHQFNGSTNYGEKSDLLRFEVLHQYGGVYVDHDANALQPFDSLHKKYKFYAGLEAPHSPIAGAQITLGNGLIGGGAGHPIFEKVMVWMRDHWKQKESDFAGRDLVVNRSYIALTKVIKESALGPRDIVFPAAYFFPKEGITPIFSNHFYACAWTEGEGKGSLFQQEVERKLDLIRCHLKRIYVGAIALSLLLTVLMISSYFYRRRLSFASSRS